MSDGSGKYLFAMVLNMLLGFTLGVARLDANMLWLDETSSAGMTSDIFTVLQLTMKA